MSCAHRSISKHMYQQEEETHAPGQMDVSTKRGTLCSDCEGSLGPKTCVNVKPTSSAIYVVATKNASVKKLNG